MESEHCVKAGSNVPFTTANYNITTTPEEEWCIIMKDRPCKNMEHQRVIPKIAQCMGIKVVEDANLRTEEVISVILYTGPMVSLL
jgi:hypothetical protein